MDLNNIDMLAALRDTTSNSGEQNNPAPKTEDKPSEENKEDKSEEPEEEEQEDEKTPESDKKKETEVKKDEKAEGSEEDEEALTETLIKKWELDPGEEEIEDSIEGLEKVVDLRAGQIFEEYFEQNPELKAYRDYLNMGGEPEKYMKTKYPDVDYKKVDINQEEIQKSVLSAFLRSQGFDEEKITKKLERYETLDTLKEEAEEALEKLQKKQEVEQANLMKEQEEKAAKDAKAAEEYWTGIKKKINDSETIKGLKLTKDMKDQVFTYMSKNVKNGFSQEMLDDAAADEETKIAIAVAKMLKMDFSKLIMKEAQTLQAKKTKLTFKGAAAKVGNKAHKTEAGGLEFADDIHLKLRQIDENRS